MFDLHDHETLGQLDFLKTWKETPGRVSKLHFLALDVELSVLSVLLVRAQTDVDDTRHAESKPLHNVSTLKLSVEDQQVLHLTTLPLLT